MVSLNRLFAVLALAGHMALGPTHLRLEVCHGEVQLPAGDGSVCCGNEHHDSTGDETQSDGPTVEDDECAECYDLEIAGVDKPFKVPETVELPMRPEFAAAVISERSSEPMGRTRYARVTRAPPDSLIPTGLLLGVFPLRI